MFDFLCIMAGTVAGLVLGVLAHEAGHAVFAALGGLRIQRIVIGIGPVLLRKRIGAVDLELRAVPFSGFVKPIGYETASRLGVVLFTLGGVIGNITVIGVTVLVFVLVPLSLLARFALVYVVYAVAAAQLLIIVFSLIPARRAMNGTPIASDGLQIIQLLRRRHSLDTYRAYCVMLRRYQLTGTPQVSAAMPVIIPQIARAEKFTNEWARRDVLAILQRQLDTGALTPVEEMLVLDGLLTTGLITGDPEYRPHLAAWAQRTAVLGPDIATLTGSRGAVLVELGDFAAGKALLESVATTDAHDSAITAAFLARAEAGLGDTAAAHRHADAARQAVDGDPSLAWIRPLIERVARKLDGGRDQSAACTSISASRSGMSTMTSWPHGTSWRRHDGSVRSAS